MEKRKFEELMTELEIIVKDLESGDIDLDTSIKKYTDAMTLAKLCGEQLNQATEAVNKILTENGNLEEFKIEN